MKRLILLFLALGLCNTLFAQVNLVPNNSMELYDSCPNAEGQIERALGWLNFGGTLQGLATPDYYNVCNAGAWNVPNGGLCHQNAYNGAAFGAIYTFAPNTYREFIGIHLNQSLAIGTKYFIAFQTCMGENFSSGCPSNKIGMRLSTVPYSLSNPLTPDNFAHIYTDSIINDSINWHLIHGSVIADSAYQYLIIGNFFDDANTDTIKYNANSFYSYYLIDDVCLSTDSLLCSGTTSLNNIEIPSIEVFPNPVSDNLSIKFQKVENAEIIIYDVFGQIVYTGKVINENQKIINLSILSKGYYFLKVNSKREGKIIIKNIIKI